MLPDYFHSKLWVSRFFVLPALLLLGVFACIAAITPAESQASSVSKGREAAFGPAAADCGYDWVTVPSLNPSATNDYLNSVDAAGPNDVWAVGYYVVGPDIKPLIERWNGVQWSVVSLPAYETDMYLTGVSARTATDVWAVGHQDTGSLEQSLTMYWDGTAWSVVPSPNVGDSMDNRLSAVTALASNNVWAVGYRYDIGVQEDVTLVLHWNGSVWSVVDSPNATGIVNRLYSVSAASANDIWAVGYTNNGRDLTLIEHWNGSTWSIVSSPSLGDDHNRLYGVAVASANDVWAVGLVFLASTETALIEHWNGSTWTAVSDIGLEHWSTSLAAVTVASPNNVWAVGYRYQSGTGYLTFVDHWNGSAWAYMSSPNIGSTQNGLYSVTVSATSPQDVWAVGYANNGSSTPDLTHIARYHPCQATCTKEFTDVLPGSTFYPYVRCLACREVLGGYPDNTFRPNANITRGQIAKIVSNSAGFSDDVTGRHTYADVAVSSTFYLWIERLTKHQVMGGYACGATNEPCDSESRPYFRPGSNATRGQVSKIVSNAAGFDDTPIQQTFADVPPGSTFYDWIERLALRQVMGGYQCGGAGEPCDSENRPYFRPNNKLTRGQTAKIVGNTFFPDCYTPALPGEPKR